jgi:hypothetical protein
MENLEAHDRRLSAIERHWTNVLDHWCIVTARLTAAQYVRSIDYLAQLSEQSFELRRVQRLILSASETDEDFQRHCHKLVFLYQRLMRDAIDEVLFGTDPDLELLVC